MPDESAAVVGSNYPAELEGSDPKALDEVGRGKESFLQIGDFNFDAVRYALTDHPFRRVKTKHRM